MPMVFSSYKRFIWVFIISLLTVYFINAQTIDTVQVGTGWNMVGALKTGLAGEILITEPDSIIISSFFVYNPGGGYEAKDTLKKGTGYWVKVNADGEIIFGGSHSGELTCGSNLEYGGKIYHTVIIGSQCWMKENLDLGIMIHVDTSQIVNPVIEKYCYDNLPDNCYIYGGLYMWDEAMQYSLAEGAKGICPTGWHIPSLTDFATLSSAVLGSGNALKAVGQGTGGGAGTNTSGFTGLLAGAGAMGMFGSLTQAGYFWTSSSYSSTDKSVMGLDATTNNITTGNLKKEFGLSIRCIKD
jgi:uncharacterized protein (TIGR02145 family)